MSLFRYFKPNFIAISEHWLHDYNLHLLHYISNEYKFLAVSPPQEEDPIYCIPQLTRAHGGVAMGWHKSLDNYVTPPPFASSSRMVGIKYNPQNSPLFIISVYMPSRSGCTDAFREALDQLEAVIMLLPLGALLLMLI